MSEMTDAERQVYCARNTLHNAIMDVGRERGAEMVTRERIRGDAAFGTVRDLPPIDGLKAARELPLQDLGPAAHVK